MPLAVAPSLRDSGFGTPLVTGAPGVSHGPELQLLIGTTGARLNGVPVSYPMVGVEDATPANFPDRLVVIQDRKSKSGAMKHDGEPRWNRVHPACVTTPSRRKQLARAVQRERRDLALDLQA